MDPATGWTIVKNVADATKKLYDIAKGVKDYETKRQLDGVLDELRGLKQQASDLEDENRNLREQLRFKSDEFEFRNPFHYEKKYPDRPLCAKCFAKQVIAPMSEPYQADGTWRRCLVCDNRVEIERGRRHNPGPFGGSGGPNSWMR